MSVKDIPETIMCIRSNDFIQLIGELSNGFTSTSESEIIELLSKCGIWFGPRNILEHDEGFWQIIPYVILKTNNKFALYSRSKSSGESRLHDKFSIGFGGHINLDDVIVIKGSVDTLATIRLSAEREVYEEVKCDKVLRRSFLGLLRDDLTSVNRVHLGLVELWEIDSVKLQPMERAIVKPIFVSKEDLRSRLSQLESWSQHIVKSII